MILDGEQPQTVHDKGRWIVYAKSIDSKINLRVGGVNGTSLVIYERNADGTIQRKPKATVWIHWGPKTRLTVSGAGSKAQDYRLMGDGRLIEIKKAEEENYIKMAKAGQFLSLGGNSNEWPDALRNMETEVRRTPEQRQHRGLRCASESRQQHPALLQSKVWSRRDRAPS